METRYFEFKDKRSNKFWQITYGESTGYTIKYGKIGYAGQTRSSIAGSKVEARSKALSLITKKIDKGYVERNSNSPLAKAASKKAVLRKPARPSIKSKKPNKPNAPVDYVESWRTIGPSISLSNGQPTVRSMTLQGLLNKVKGMDPKDVFYQRQVRTIIASSS